MQAVLSAKGLITLPEPLRDRLGLRPGQLLEFHEERGHRSAEALRSCFAEGQVIACALVWTHAGGHARPPALTNA